MMLYKKKKAVVHSSDGDTNFFDIVTGDLQENILSAFLFIICQGTSINPMKENGFTLRKKGLEVNFIS